MQEKNDSSSAKKAEDGNIMKKSLSEILDEINPKPKHTADIGPYVYCLAAMAAIGGFL